ncbi:MAG: TIM barrel protein [Opitutaceae bacterium]|jgi:ribulose-phosphate 3-epimerase|nr:TIM barrel protein [Opitutaceae bacterium]
MKTDTRKKNSIALGLKTDAIETRYSFPWLFDLLAEEGVRHVQVGSFFEIYTLEDGWFENLKAEATQRGLILKSVFTAHRELGGFFYGDPFMERTARRGCERLLRAAALLGADYCGWNPGAIYRDRPDSKPAGLACFHRHLRELMRHAHSLGLKAITLEPMSCLAEPPSTPDEIRTMMETAAAYHCAHYDTTVPVYLCGDISHGVADRDRKVVHGNLELFEFSIPWMAEFHFKNTDAIFNSTFGFNKEERARGIVDLGEILRRIERSADRWPVDDIVGYLEISGPKIGRDYSDYRLGNELRASLRAIKNAFAEYGSGSAAASGPLLSLPSPPPALCPLPPVPYVA